MPEPGAITKAMLARESLRRELLALPPRRQAELLGITGPYDANLCPICFDHDPTGCLACGGAGTRAASEESREALDG